MFIQLLCRQTELQWFLLPQLLHVESRAGHTSWYFPQYLQFGGMLLFGFFCIFLFIAHIVGVLFLNALPEAMDSCFSKMTIVSSREMFHSSSIFSRASVSFVPRMMWSSIASSLQVY